MSSPTLKPIPTLMLWAVYNPRTDDMEIVILGTDETGLSGYLQVSVGRVSLLADPANWEAWWWLMQQTYDHRVYGTVDA